MDPRRVSIDDIAGTLPANPRSANYSWKEALEAFLRASPGDSVLDIDLAMGLDRFFGLPDGWSSQLMTRYYVLCELRENAGWLNMVSARSYAKPRPRLQTVCFFRSTSPQALEARGADDKPKPSGTDYLGWESFPPSVMTTRNLKRGRGDELISAFAADGSVTVFGDRNSPERSVAR